jgi:hypothetical protein
MGKACQAAKASITNGMFAEFEFIALRDTYSNA